MNYKKCITVLSLLLSMEIAANADLIIENITLIDAEHPVRSNQTVLIENGKIESIIKRFTKIKTLKSFFANDK